jgi:hypothetical protein
MHIFVVELEFQNRGGTLIPCTATLGGNVTMPTVAELPAFVLTFVTPPTKVASMGIRYETVARVP